MIQISTCPPRRNRLLSLLLTLIVLALLAVVGISVYAASVLTNGTHKPLNMEFAAQISQPRTDVSFSSRDSGITLNGWLVKATNPSGRSFVMTHGWQANRTEPHFHDIANAMLADGYDVLLYDLRSCGESGGDRFTLGNKEDEDVLGAYDYMKQQGYDPAQITMFGVSMGGASVIEASSRMTDVGAIVIDSTFANLRPIVERELPKRSNLPDFMSQPILFTGKLLFGMDADLRPADAVRALPERAFLFMHGSGDTFITPDNSAQLKEASSNPDSKLVIYQAGQHVSTYADNPDAYLRDLKGFINQQISNQ